MQKNVNNILTILFAAYTSGLMKLSDYLKSTAQGDTEFGKAADLSGAQVNRIKHGKSKPSFGAMKRIQEASKGKVKPGDFFEVIK